MEAKIIGVRGAGKSTLLEALAAGRATSGLTSVKVVDDRVRRLSAHYNPKKTTFAEFRTADVDWPRGDGRRGRWSST